MANPNVGYGAAACGAILTLITGGVGLFSAFHVFVDPGGGISKREAMPFFISGCVCSFPSLAIIAIGIFLAMKAKKDAGAATPGGPPPGPPPT